MLYAHTSYLQMLRTAKNHCSPRARPLLAAGLPAGCPRLLRASSTGLPSTQGKGKHQERRGAPVYRISACFLCKAHFWHLCPR